MCYSLEQDAFYPLVEFCYPVIEVRIAFQVKSVDLQLYERDNEDKIPYDTDRCLNLP